MCLLVMSFGGQDASGGLHVRALSYWLHPSSLEGLGPAGALKADGVVLKRALATDLVPAVDAILAGPGYVLAGTPPKG